MVRTWSTTSLSFVPASNSGPTTENQIYSPNQSHKTPPLLVSLLPASPFQPPPIRAKWFHFFFFFWTIKSSHSLPASEFQPHASDGGWGPCYSKLWIKSLICLFLFRWTFLFPQTSLLQSCLPVTLIQNFMLIILCLTLHLTLNPSRSGTVSKQGTWHSTCHVTSLHYFLLNTKAWNERLYCNF